jgi:hypothetical protein
MRWPFRKRTSYRESIRETGEGFFDASVLLASQVKQGWENVQNLPNLTTQDDWLIVREVLWYMISQCDRVVRHEWVVQNADEVMDGITYWSLTRFMVAFDFSASPSNVRQTQQRQLETWQAEAAAAYREGPDVVPVEQHHEIIRTASLVPNSPLDRLNRRIEKSLGITLTNQQTGNAGDTGVAGIESIYDRITEEGISLEDVVVITVGPTGNNMRDLLKETHLDEVLLGKNAYA